MIDACHFACVMLFLRPAKVCVRSYGAQSGENYDGRTICSCVACEQYLGLIDGGFDCMLGST